MCGAVSEVRNAPRINKTKIYLESPETSETFKASKVFKGGRCVAGRATATAAPATMAMAMAVAVAVAMATC